MNYSDGDTISSISLIVMVVYTMATNIRGRAGMSAPDISKLFSGNIVTILFWLFLMGSLTLFFNGYIQQRDNPNQALMSANSGTGEVTLKRNRDGHYLAPGYINGHPVNFLLDTGATNVSIPAAIAEAAGLKKALHRWSRQLMVWCQYFRPMSTRFVLVALP
ncbi:hypothetical protein GCM10025856_26670 [Methylophaga marina]|nr:hypothetical protein GCM10025856_26670 [Methylophaga marina]